MAGAAVAEGQVAVEVVHAHLEVLGQRLAVGVGVLGGYDPLGHVDVDAADRVDDIDEAGHVDEHVVVDRDAEELGDALLNRLRRDIVAAAVCRLETDLVVVAQAGRTRLWAGQYQWATKRGWERLGEPMQTTWDELATRLQLPVAFAGEIDAAAAKLLRRANRAAIIAPPAESVRRAAMLAEIGWQRWKRKQTDAAESLAPLYLREPG